MNLLKYNLYLLCRWFAKFDLEIAKLGENKDLIALCKRDVAKWEYAIDDLILRW